MLCTQLGPKDWWYFDTHSHWQQMLATLVLNTFHDDVIKWKHFPRYWPFVWGIHRSPVNSPHKGQWRGALKFSLICAWINGWVNKREAGDLKCHHTHYDVTVMAFWLERNKHSPCFTKQNQPRITWLYYFFDLVIYILLFSKALYMLIKILRLNLNILIDTTWKVSYMLIHPYFIPITVYPKKHAHVFCFVVLCCGYTLTDFPISIRLTSLALWQSNDCPSASKATLMNMDKYVLWIHYEWLHNHNKAKHNKTVCIFLGIYCSMDLLCLWV